MTNAGLIMKVTGATVQRRRCHRHFPERRSRGQQLPAGSVVTVRFGAQLRCWTDSARFAWFCDTISGYAFACRTAIIQRHADADILNMGGTNNDETAGTADGVCPFASATADLETEITGVSYDSRATRPGDLFVAHERLCNGWAPLYRRGHGKGRGGGAVPAAAGGGHPLCADGGFPPGAGGGGCQLVRPSRGGDDAWSAVTGTSGKTTTTYLLKAILEQSLGAKVGLIGTNQNMIGDRRCSPRSAPRRSPLRCRSCFREMRGRGLHPCGDGDLLPRAVPGPGVRGFTTRWAFSRT